MANTHSVTAPYQIYNHDYCCRTYRSHVLILCLFLCKMEYVCTLARLCLGCRIKGCVEIDEFWMKFCLTHLCSSLNRSSNQCLCRSLCSGRYDLADLVWMLCLVDLYIVLYHFYYIFLYHMDSYIFFQLTNSSKKYNSLITLISNYLSNWHYRPV